MLCAHCSWKGRSSRDSHDRRSQVLPQISRQFSQKWMEREILPKIPSRMEQEMLTSMEGERVKGSPKEKTETGHQKITRSKADIQVAQDEPMLVENLLESLVKKVEKATESPGIKMIPR